MASLIEIGIGIATSLTAAEVVAHAPTLTNWLIARAVRKLPKDDRARFSEEWLAHAEELPGSFGKLWHGLGCYLKAARLIRRARHMQPLSRRIAASVLQGMAWVVLMPVYVPGLLTFRRDPQRLYIFRVSCRLIVKTFAFEIAYRGSRGKEVKAAIGAVLDKIDAIIKSDARPPDHS